MSLKERKKEMFPEAKKAESKYEDNRYSGMTVNKARQSQRRELVISGLVKNAKIKKSMGMELSPEEAWVLHNSELFL